MYYGHVSYTTETVVSNYFVKKKAVLDCIISLVLLNFKTIAKGSFSSAL